MKTVPEAVQEIEDQAVLEGVSKEWFFDFPFDDLANLPPDAAAQWLIDVLNGHQYADTYVSQFLIELSDHDQGVGAKGQPTQQYQQWFSQMSNHPEFDGLY